MTIPLDNLRQQQMIDEVTVSNDIDWRTEHLNLLRHHYRGAPYQREMLELVEKVLEKDLNNLSEISTRSTIALAHYFELDLDTFFVNSPSLKIEGKSSQRLCDMCRHFGAKTYITGHGAKNYLEHELFERNGIDVEYIDYQCVAYPQLHGEFTPYVTGLDVIANCGRSGAKFIRPLTKNWRKFINES